MTGIRFRDLPAAAWLRSRRNRALHVLKNLRYVHPSAYVHSTARVAKDLKAEEYVFIAPGCVIDPGVRIGRYSMLASHVAVLGDDHVTDVAGVPAQFAGRPPQHRTDIGRDVWIGYRAVVRRGVSIGDGAIVGANAVVTRDVEPFQVVVGSPARVVGERFVDLEQRRKHQRMLEGPVVAPSFAEPLRPMDASEETQCTSRY